MRIPWLPLALVLMAASTDYARADLKAALAEPNLEKRSRLALDNAAAAYKTLRAAYDAGEMEKVAAAANELQESVECAHLSLKQTGKVPRRSPKYFKAAEIATRDMLRRLNSFQEGMSFDERPVLDKVKKRVLEIHDEMLTGLMEGKRK